MYFHKNKEVNIDGLKYSINKVTKEKLSTIFDDNFSVNIVSKGRIYYIENKVTNYNYDNNIITADVIGRNTYHVKLVINNNKIKDYECTCPYYQKENKICKHIYATLLKYCYEDNIDMLIKEEYEEDEYILNKKDAYKKYKQIIEQMRSTLRELYHHLLSIEDKEDRDNFAFKTKEYGRSIRLYSKKKLDDMTPELIKEASRYLNGMKSDLPTIVTINLDINVTTDVEETVDNSFSNLFNTKLPSDEEKRKADIEKRIKLNNLSEEEAEEVRKGNFDPEDFEEEGDLTEDDYYYEDR